MATPDMLRKAILSRLQTWHSSTPFTDDPTWTSTLRDVINSQDSIGWKALLEGLPSKRWKQYMATLPHTCSPLRTSHSWTLKFLHALHSLAWSQWEHRNSTLHQLDRPRQRKAEELLNSLIILELTTAPVFAFVRPSLFSSPAWTTTIPILTLQAGMVYKRHFGPPPPPTKAPNS